MENDKKIYVGSGIEFGKYGDVNIDICLSDLPPDWIKKSEKNGKKYIKLVLSKKKEKDQYGKTHSLTVNTWKKDEQKDGLPY